MCKLHGQSVKSQSAPERLQCQKPGEQSTKCKDTTQKSLHILKESIKHIELESKGLHAMRQCKSLKREAVMRAPSSGGSTIPSASSTSSRRSTHLPPSTLDVQATSSAYSSCTTANLTSKIPEETEEDLAEVAIEGETTCQVMRPRQGWCGGFDGGSDI